MRRKYTFEDSAVSGDLKYWGYHKGKQYAADGYSIEDTLHALMVADDSIWTWHKVLCLDMPRRAWDINQIVMTLGEDSIAALTGRYCLPVDTETGRLYPDQRIAQALGWSERTFQRRVGDAKDKYRVRIFGPTLAELQAVSC